MKKTLSLSGILFRALFIGFVTKLIFDPIAYLWKEATKKKRDAYQKSRESFELIQKENKRLYELIDKASRYELLDSMWRAEVTDHIKLFGVMYNKAVEEGKFQPKTTSRPAETLEYFLERKKQKAEREPTEEIMPSEAKKLHSVAA